MNEVSPTLRSEAGSKSRRTLVPALENAIAIINFLNETVPHDASLAELSTKLGITKSHCHAILKTLAHAEWLRFDDRTKTYQLHSGLIASGSSLLSSPLLSRIRERLDLLVRQTGFSCVLTQPQNDDSFVVIENLTATRSMEVSHPVGFHFPKDAPAQMRAFMSWQPPGRLEEWMRGWIPTKYTEATIVTEAALRSELQATRDRGYSRSVGEHFEAMMAFGLPIFDRDGDVLYVFCIMGIVQAIAPHEQAIAAQMKQTAREIHGAILGRPPANFII